MASTQNSFYTAEEPNIGSQNLSGMESSMPSNGSKRVNEIVDDNRKLTSNIGFIHAMYQLMRGAAVQACSGKHFYHDPNDITILGGAAYNIYADTLKIPLMPTSDIDMTWWPRTDIVIPPKELTILSSLVLQSIPKEPSPEWNAAVGSILGIEVSKIEFKLEDKPFPPNRRDVIMNSTIELSMILNGNLHFKNLCSLAIRNALNSQEFTTNHRVVGKNELGMTYDPTYCNLFNTAIVGSSRVPQLANFISQQLFSYKNLFLTGKIEKANIQLQRVIHMYVKVKTDDIASQLLFTYRTILTQRPSAIQSFMEMIVPNGLWDHMQFIIHQMMQQHTIQQQVMQQQIQSRQERRAHARQAQPLHQPLPQQQLPQQQLPQQQLPQQQLPQQQLPQQQLPQQQPNVSDEMLTIEEARVKLRQIIEQNRQICIAFKLAMKKLNNKEYANYTDNIKNSTKYTDDQFKSVIRIYKDTSTRIERDPSVQEDFKAVNRQLMGVFNSIILGGYRKKRTIKRKKNKSKTKKRSTR
jgi:hypothetical protein